MKALFKEILDIENVHGVMFLSLEGRTLFQEFKPMFSTDLGPRDPSALTALLKEIDEAEIVFERCLLYIIKASGGYVLVVMGKQAPVAMVRLNCSIILPSLEAGISKPKGLARFFRRNK